jgi:DNA-binding response OmpR family regulator
MDQIGEARTDTLPRLQSITRLDGSRTARTLLRFGGLTMEPVTGATSWRGKMLQLGADDRVLLGVLLRRGGQIISSERLAAMVGATAEALELQMAAMTETLRQAGVTCLPRRARGLGWILWRG